MSDGYDDITTNDRRATYEKRADGTMAWRVITHDDQIETGSAERVFVHTTSPIRSPSAWIGTPTSSPSSPDKAATGAKRFTGSPSTGAERRTDPKTHVVYIGGPGGRAGDDSGSVPNIIIRQVWASPSPRPDSINQ